MKKDNSKVLAIILPIVAIIVVILSFLFNKKEPEKNDILIVNSASNYFTVNSCLYRVTTYISNNDTDSLLKVLNETYKKKNNITASNVLDKFQKIEKNSTFVSKKMYYEEINENVTKYYVYGVFRPNIIHDYTIVEQSEDLDAYFIVYLDSSKQLYSIEPYNGDLFMDGDKNG